MCFYCRDENEFEKFVTDANKLLAPPKQRISYPLCMIVEGRAREHKLRRVSDVLSCAQMTLPSDESFTEISAPSGANAAVSSDSVAPPKTDGESWTDLTASSSSSSNTGASERLAGDVARGKTDRFDFMSAPRTLMANFRRQQSRSPKTKRKQDRALEEDFELL